MKRTMFVSLPEKAGRVESDTEKELFLTARWISGVCFGIEFLWDHKIMVIDIGIVRLYFIIREK